MNPISNQLPPYSQHDIELYALQKPFYEIITYPVEITFPKPFEIMSPKKSEKSNLKKNKQEDSRKDKEQESNEISKED